MKEQHLIFKAGELEGKIIARDPQRARFLFAEKRGGQASDYVAVAEVRATQVVWESARRASIKEAA